MGWELKHWRKWMQKIISFYILGDWRSAKWPLALSGNCWSRVTLELRRGCCGWFSGRRTTPHLEQPLESGLSFSARKRRNRDSFEILQIAGWWRLLSSAPIADARGECVRGCWILRWLDRAHPSFYHVGLTHAQDRIKLWFLRSDFFFPGK